MRRITLLNNEDLEVRAVCTDIELGAILVFPLEAAAMIG